MPIILGIDPGFSGALTALKFDEKESFDAPKLLALWDLPIDLCGGSSGLSLGASPGRPEIDGRKLTDLILSLPQRPITAFIERVGSSPQMGVVSAFRFGQGEGVVCGVCNGLGIKIRKITPQVWKSHFELNTNKKLSLLKIKELYPSTHHHYFKLNQHDGRAESALIAHFGWQKFHRGQKPVETIADLI